MVCFALYLKLSNPEMKVEIAHPGKSKRDNIHTVQKWIQFFPFVLSGQVLHLTLAKPEISTEIQPIITFSTPRKKGNIDELKVHFSPS